MCVFISATTAANFRKYVKEASQQHRTCLHSVATELKLTVKTVETCIKKNKQKKNGYANAIIKLVSLTATARDREHLLSQIK